MFSIKIDNDIVQEIKEVEILNIIPHEKVLIDKKEVLKGLSQTMIYGEKGRNGVILITTKNGKNSDPE